jgi:NifB/MoaA-like Fe-S oxidoreductase
MKINYKLDSNNYILTYTEFPLNESLPILDTKGMEIIIGISKVVNGVIDNNTPSNLFFENKKIEKISEFRSFREELLKKYDILRINIQSGDYDPKTGKVYSPLSEEEKQWRLSMLDFTDSITHETTEKDYPETPDRLK